MRLCAIVVPLTLLWGASAIAADTEAGGGSVGAAASGNGASAVDSSDNEGSAKSDQFEAADEGYGFGLSGPGTDNPLGFSSAFAPRGCAPSLRLSNVARTGSGSVLNRPPAPARSAGRYIQASVSGSETYTDNLNLSSHDRQDDFITSVAPRIDACSSTGRIRGQGSYQLQGVVYADHSQYNDVYNDLAGSTTIDLIQNHLYLDANTRYGQQVIDPSFGGVSRSNIIRPNENKTTVWRTNLSPYLVQSLGLLGQGLLRYRYGRSFYDSDVPDRAVQSVSATVTSPPTVLPISWQAQAVTQSVRRSGGNEQRIVERFREIYGDDALPDGYRDPNRTQHFDSATLELGYHVSRTLTLTALGGIEDDYRNGENDRWSSTRYQVGARWSSAGNSLEANVGHRFYGTSYSFSAAHRGRVFDLSLNYSENPSSPGLDALNDTGSGYTYGSVGSIDDLLNYSDRNDYYGTDSVLGRGVFVRKRAQARIGFDTARTHTHITGYSQRRDYQSANVSDSRQHGAEIDVRYDLARRTSLVPSARWTHYDSGFENVGESDEYSAGVSIVRAISPSAEIAAGYSRQWRDVDDGRGYRENRVTLQFRKGF